MYKVFRGEASPGSEAASKEVVKVVDQSTDEVVFQADADSLFVLKGSLAKLSGVSDPDLLAELLRKGKLH
ncbi:MAG: hypothetical protein ABSF12_18475 [Bryobacteraceae bacterium]|jgi:hypothetical protein